MKINKMKSIFAKLDEINYALLYHYEEITGHSLTPKQALVLEHVHRHSTLTVSELANKMKVTSGAISQLLTKLEQQEYIVRSINSNSRREIVVTLGEKGTDLYQAYEKIDQKIVEQYFSKLSPKVIVQLESAVNELHAIVRSEKGIGVDGLD